MSLTAAIFQKLSTTDAITDLVGSQIYAVQSPENVYPVLVFTYSNATENDLNSAPSVSRYNLTTYSVAVDPITAHAIADNVKTALNKQSGTWAGVKIKRILFQGDEEAESSAQDAPQKSFYIVTQQYKVLTKEV